jgi:hypothetical protein
MRRKANMAKKPMEPLPEELYLTMRACYAAGRADQLMAAIKSGEIEAPSILVQSLEGQQQFWARIIDERVDNLAPHSHEYMREGVLNVLRDGRKS